MSWIQVGTGLITCTRRYWQVRRPVGRVVGCLRGSEVHWVRVASNFSCSWGSRLLRVRISRNGLILVRLLWLLFDPGRDGFVAMWARGECVVVVCEVLLIPKLTADGVRLPMRFKSGRDDLFLGRDDLFLVRDELLFSERGFQFLAKVAASSDGRGWFCRFLTGEGASLPMSWIVTGWWTGSTSAPPNVRFFWHRKIKRGYLLVESGFHTGFGTMSGRLLSWRWRVSHGFRHHVRKIITSRTVPGFRHHVRKISPEFPWLAHWPAHTNIFYILYFVTIDKWDRTASGEFIEDRKEGGHEVN